MADLFTKVQEKVAGKDVKIVFPEGLDERILVAVNNLAGNKVLKPIVVGNKEDIQAKAKELNLTLDGVDIFDPHTYEGMEELVQAFVERRKGKATEEQARKALLDENYFGTMLVYKGLADGLVSGAAHSTADTVRPALQIIKTKEGVKKHQASSSWPAVTSNMYSLIARSTLPLTARTLPKLPLKAPIRLKCLTLTRALPCSASLQKDRRNQMRRTKWLKP